MADKEYYVVHTKQGYWVGAFIFDEQLRKAKIYTSLHYAEKTAERLKHVNADKYDPEIREVNICLADEMPAADVVEVVRCKDCINNTENGGDCDRVLIHTHRNLVTETNEYLYFRLNYCEYGERKEQT